MNIQQYYDLLVENSLNGNFPAIYGGRCRYRTKDGKKCSIGLLIPDECYVKSMELCSPEELLHENDDWFPSEIEPSQFGNIQSIHDNQSVREPWSAKDFVAELNKLDCFQNINQRTL